MDLGTLSSDLRKSILSIWSWLGGGTDHWTPPARYAPSTGNVASIFAWGTGPFVGYRVVNQVSFACINAKLGRFATKTGCLNFFWKLNKFCVAFRRDAPLQDRVYANRFLVHGQVTIIFVVSVCLSVCLFVQSFPQPSSIRFGPN